MLPLDLTPTHIIFLFLMPCVAFHPTLASVQIYTIAR